MPDSVHHYLARAARRVLLADRACTKLALSQPLGAVRTVYQREARAPRRRQRGALSVAGRTGVADRRRRSRPSRRASSAVPARGAAPRPPGRRRACRRGVPPRACRRASRRCAGWRAGRAGSRGFAAARRPPASRHDGPAASSCHAGPALAWVPEGRYSGAITCGGGTVCIAISGNVPEAASVRLQHAQHEMKGATRASACRSRACTKAFSP